MPIARHLTPEARNVCARSRRTACYWSNTSTSSRVAVSARPSFAGPGLGGRLATERTRPIACGLAREEHGRLGGTGHDRAPRICRAQEIHAQAKQPRKRSRCWNWRVVPDRLPYPALLAIVRGQLDRAGLAGKADFETRPASVPLQSSVPGLVELSWQEPTWAVTAPGVREPIPLRSGSCTAVHPPSSAFPGRPLKSTAARALPVVAARRHARPHRLGRENPGPPRRRQAKGKGPRRAAPFAPPPTCLSCPSNLSGSLQD